MLSRENLVIVACVLVALPVSYAVSTVSGAPDWADMAVLFAVGIALPQAINEYLDRRAS